MALAVSGTIKTFNALANAAMTLVDLPVTPASTDGELKIVTAVTDTPVGFLQTLAGAAGDAISVSHDGQEVYGVSSGGTAFVAGDWVGYTAADPTQLEKITADFDGTFSTYKWAMGIAREADPGDGNRFLLIQKITKLPVA